MTDTTTMTDDFFDRYAAALLARDEKAVAALERGDGTEEVDPAQQVLLLR